MKILLHDYGGYPFTFQLAESLTSRGHKVEYFYSDTTQSIKRINIRDSIPKLRIHALQIKKSFKKYSYLKRRACEVEHGKLLAMHISQLQPDVVISANTPLDAQRLALRASRKVNAHFFFWFQDAISIATMKTLSAKIPILGRYIGQYYGWLEGRLVKKSDQIILISEDFLPLMHEWGVCNEQVKIIPNWAPLEEIPVCKKKNPWAYAHDLADSFVFLYAGILGLKHNPALFIQLSQAFRLDPEVKIVVVAEGSAVDWLKKQQRGSSLNNLVVLPYQPAAVFPQMLGAADVLTAILKPDAGAYSVPSKVLSYLCAAKPLLLAVPAENLAARLIRNIDAGLVSPPSDTAQWIRNARLLYLDRRANRRKGFNARKYAEEFFDIKQITDKFEALF